MLQLERDLRRIRSRLEGDGWFVVRWNGPHLVYAHPSKPGRVTVPHGRGELPTGTARKIASQAGWVDQEG